MSCNDNIIIIHSSAFSKEVLGPRQAPGINESLDHLPKSNEVI